MQIQGTTQVHGPHGIQGPHSVHRSQSSQNAARTGNVDRVDISAAAEAAIQAAETSSVRQELVKDIRAQIAAGTYDTPAKLDAALERMLDEIA